MDTLIELPRMVMAENFRCLKHICLGALISVPVGFWFVVAFSFHTGALVSGVCLAVATPLMVRDRNKRVRRLRAFARFRDKHPVNDDVVLEG